MKVIAVAILQASKTICVRRFKQATALASKFKAVSAADSCKADDDPTWAPIDSGDLNHDFSPEQLMQQSHGVFPHGGHVID